MTQPAEAWFAEIDALDGELRRLAVPADRVPWRTRMAAQDAVRLAAADLSIPTPAVRWLPADVLRGRHAICLKTRSDTVWLADDLGPKTAAYVACHEVRHAWQHAAMRCPGGHPERDADRFAFAQLGYGLEDVIGE